MEHLSWKKVVQSCHHIETCQFISRANQLTGFYMMTTLAFNELIMNKETVILVGLSLIVRWLHLVCTAVNILRDMYQAASFSEI